MAYTKSELLNLGAVDLATERTKIVGLNLFDNIDDIKLDDRTKNTIEYTSELYGDYLSSLKNFSKSNLEKILRALKNIEVIDNHTLERENPDLLANYNETHHSTAINYLIKKLIIENSELNSTIVKKTHEILMRGTNNNELSTTGFRKNNNFYVGYETNGERNVLYYPISYDEIEKAVALFLEYYNTENNDINEVFIKPFICHGILAALQLFEDGNTRLSRTIQHIKLFETSNQLIDNEFDTPVIYFSKAYLPYRKEYRDLISNLALNPNNENWLNWLKFNLNRLQDQLFVNDTNLQRTRRK